MTTTEPNYELVMERGPQAGQTFLLDAPSHTVGRDPISDLCISDPEVSRQHGLLIRIPNGGYKIQDLGSTNGTVVDGLRLSGEAHALRPGQLIALGGSVALRYRLAQPSEDEAAQAASPRQEPPAEPSIGAPEAEVSSSLAEAPPPEPLVEEESLTREPVSEWRAEQPVRAQPAGQVAEQPVGRERSVPDDFLDADNPDQDDPGRRLLSIALGVLLVLLCLCCSLTLFIYYFGGDWLLRQFGIVP